MTPSFFGTKVVTDIKLENIFPLIDTHALFVGRWQFKRTKGTEEAYQQILKEKARPAFEEWKKRCVEEKILEPKVVYGYFTGSQVCRLTGLQVKSDIIPLQLVTVGSKAADKCRTLFEDNKYTDYLYLHGLAVETTEALAEYWNREILKELAGSQVKRISPGYPAWPALSDQKELCRLLQADRIGVTVTETFQLVPEYSTSAMILL